MKCFILSTIDYHGFFFSLLPIIYCILLFVCQSLNNKLVRHTGQQSSLVIKKETVPLKKEKEEKKTKRKQFFFF